LRSRPLYALHAAFAADHRALDRVVADDLGYRDDGIAHVTAHFGFRDRQNVPETLRLAAEHGAEATATPPTRPSSSPCPTSEP
jgi:hypothetical protein